MASPFRTIQPDDLPPEEADLVRQIDEHFTFLEEFFTEAERSPARLKMVPEFPMPTLAAPLELATMYTLRALKLAEGAASLIEARNYLATFPVLRSLYEVWAAVTYAHVRFRALVIKGNRWQKFDEIAHRLLLATTHHQDTPEVIEIGHIVGEAESHMVEFLSEDDAEKAEEFREILKETYAILSDGTHPTQFGLLAHAEFRKDKVGVNWRRDAVDDDLRKPLLFDLHFGLRLAREFIPRLRDTGNAVEAAARRGPMQDPQVKAATIQTLERILEDETTSPESATRIRSVLEHLKQHSTRTDRQT